MNQNNVKNYGWSSSAQPHTQDYIAPKLLSLLKALNARRVMDLGAGNGSLCAKLAAAGYDVVGVENDKQGCELALAEYPQIPFYNLGVEDKPEIIMNDQNTFDVVVSTEVVEHLFSPHLLPLFANQVLSRNGYLIVSTPYHGYLKNLALAIFGKWDAHLTALWHGGHIKFWSRKTLTQLLQENGFMVTEFAGVGRVPLLWKSMVLVAKKI